MWKKTATLCLAVCLLLALAACQRARVPGLDWNAEEMVELRLERVMYLVGEKTTTDPQEIQAVAEGLRSVAVLREWRPDDPCSEGSGSITFTFVREDGSQEVVCYNGCRSSLSTSEGEFLLPKDASPTQDELWALVDVPVEFPRSTTTPSPMRKLRNFSAFKKGGSSMKKILCLCFILCLSLSGCQASRVPGLDWNPEEMVELQVFTGGVPAAAQRKITRDTEDIRRVAQALFSLEAARDAVNEDVPCGGIGTYFVFCRADGSQEVVLLGSGRDLLTTGEGFYKLRQKFPLDPDALWNSLEGEAEWVGEDGLPEIGSFPPPDQP